MEEKNISRKIVFSVITVILLIVAVVGATYAYFSATASTEAQTVTTGTLTMGFTDGEILRATGITPIADSEIKTKATELPFSVTNTGSEHMNLTISLTDITISEELKDIDFRWGLYNADTGNGLSFGIFSDLGDAKEMVIYRDTIIDAADPDITKNYILRVWIHDDGALQNYMQGRSFSAKVTVDGEAIEYTPEECFTFDKETGSIYGNISDEGEYSGYNKSCPKDVVIPRTIDGVTVTEIGELAFYDVMNDDHLVINSVIIPDTVKEIGYQAFDKNNLTHVTIPEGVTLIGSYALSDLESMYLPDSVSDISNEAFIDSLFKSLVIPGSNKVIGDKFSGTLTSIVLMEGVEKIGEMGLYSHHFTTIEIPKSVTSIERDAFMECSLLEEIVVRGKTSLANFTDSTGLTTEGGLPEGVNIIFRP